MKTWKKIAIITVCVVVGAVVVVKINDFLNSEVATSEENTLRLSPGFPKTSRIVKVNPTTSKRTSITCYRYNWYNEDEVEPFTADAYGSIDKELTLILEKDFVVPITITVKAADLEPNKETDLNPEGRDADPAIVITSSDGKFSSCYDYSEDHGSEEVLHTSNRNVSRRFEPKAGTYYVDLWSYYQPAKQYEVIISEDN